MLRKLSVMGCVMVVMLTGCGRSAEVETIKKDTLITIFDMYEKKIEALEVKASEQEEIITTLTSEVQQVSDRLELTQEKLSQQTGDVNLLLKNGSKLEGINDRLDRLDDEIYMNVLHDQFLEHILEGSDAYRQHLGWVSYNHKQLKRLRFDEVEWVDSMDLQRIEELGIDPEFDMPNGFYLHNVVSGMIEITLTREVLCLLYDDQLILGYGDLSMIEEKLEQTDQDGLLCRLITMNGHVVAVEEVYLP